MSQDLILLRKNKTRTKFVNTIRHLRMTRVADRTLSFLRGDIYIEIRGFRRTPMIYYRVKRNLFFKLHLNKTENSVWMDQFE